MRMRPAFRPNNQINPKENSIIEKGFEFAQDPIGQSANLIVNKINPIKNKLSGALLNLG